MNGKNRLEVVQRKTCAGCVHRIKNDRELNQWLCIKNPPQLTLLPGPQGIASLVGYPPVDNNTIACSGFDAAVEEKTKNDGAGFVMLK